MIFVSESNFGKQSGKKRDSLFVWNNVGFVIRLANFLQHFGKHIFY